MSVTRRSFLAIDNSNEIDTRPELDSQDFVKFNYQDGGRKGLLSGKALHLDLKRLE